MKNFQWKQWADLLCDWDFTDLYFISPAYLWYLKVGIFVGFFSFFLYIPSSTFLLCWIKEVAIGICLLSPKGPDPLDFLAFSVPTCIENVVLEHIQNLCLMSSVKKKVFMILKVVNKCRSLLCHILYFIFNSSFPMLSTSHLNFEKNIHFCYLVFSNEKKIWMLFFIYRSLQLRGLVLEKT